MPPWHRILAPAIQETATTVRTITLTIPEILFLQLEAAARSSAQSVDAIIVQSIERTIPPHLVTLLPTVLQAELDAMEHLSNATLRAIADSIPLPECTQQMDDLIALKQAGAITLNSRNIRRCYEAILRH